MKNSCIGQIFGRLVFPIHRKRTIKCNDIHFVIFFFRSFFTPSISCYHQIGRCYRNVALFLWIFIKKYFISSWATLPCQIINSFKYIGYESKKAAKSRTVIRFRNAAGTDVLQGKPRESQPLPREHHSSVHGSQFILLFTTNAVISLGRCQSFTSVRTIWCSNALLLT